MVSREIIPHPLTATINQHSATPPILTDHQLLDPIQEHFGTTEQFVIFSCSSLKSPSVQDRPHVRVNIMGISVRALLDSGCNCTVLGRDCMELIGKLNLQPTKMRGQIKTADGTVHPIRLCVDIPLSLIHI